MNISRVHPIIILELHPLLTDICNYKMNFICNVIHVLLKAWLDVTLNRGKSRWATAWTQLNNWDGVYPIFLQRCAGLGQFYRYSFCAGQEIGFTKASKSHMENGWLFQLACYMLGTAQSCSWVTFERNLLTGLDLTITGIYIKTVQKQEKKKDEHWVGKALHSVAYL